ncbi:MAG: hypothetical protein KKB50_10105 [Planctomycetes bacterium]|nr:hypothetical protein [Planctomycetota bacterium]
MPAKSDGNDKARYGLDCAQTSCLVLGVALLVWGIAPAVVQRVTSSDPQWLSSVLLGSAALLVGSTFLGFHVLIRRGVCWALWAAFWLSLGLATIAVCVVMLARTEMISVFLLVLSGCTTFTTWLAIRSQSDKVVCKAA